MRQIRSVIRRTVRAGWAGPLGRENAGCRTHAHARTHTRTRARRHEEKGVRAHGLVRRHGIARLVKEMEGSVRVCVGGGGYVNGEYEGPEPGDDSDGHDSDGRLWRGCIAATNLTVNTRERYLYDKHRQSMFHCAELLR